MNRRELIPVSPEKEASFREAFELREDLKGDPEWELAYEHAAKYALYPDELNTIGAALVRKKTS